MWIKAKARWGGLSEYLTRPAESIQDVEERHKVRLLAGMLLAMLLAALIIAPIWVLSSPEFPASLPISIGMITALVCALLFGRTRHYQLALYILIGLVPGIVITTILTSPGDIQNRLLALGFLIVGIMLASIVLNIRATVIMTLVCVGFTGAFFFVPGIPFDYVFSFLVYIAVTGALSVVATIIRSNYAQQLKENQQELDAFFNQSLSGCFFMEADEPFDWDNAPNRQELLRKVGNQMRVTRANDAILEQYGATQQQMIGMTFYDFFTHDMVQGLYILGQLLDAGKLRIETHERRLDGTPIRVEGDYVCFRDNRRCIIGLFGVQRDVTQRSRVEQALRQSEERYRALFEQAHDAIFIIDLQGRYLEANPRAAGMFGYTTEEMRHISISDISTEYEGSMSVLRRLLDGEEVPIYERHFRKKNGDILTAEVSSELVRDTEGHPLHFQCVLRDITERKELEKSLRESEARYRSVVNVLSEGIILHDINGAIIACNSASERILGLTKDQMMGRTSLDPRWHTIHEDGSIFPGEIHPAMVTLRTGESFKDVIMGVQHPGGELRWISVTTQPLVLPDVAQPYAVVVSFTDITERKQSDDALRMIEARQRALLSAIPDLMFRYDRDGNFLDYHATDASRLALPPHLFLGRNIRDVLPELAPLHMHYSERALATREEIIYEYTLPLDDEPIYFE
ncbi:MAG: PAS domain S-box protein, partial [Anaerolineae bacterium]|nr:PAS domain S-box protein [Anaerolineae bacterium]